MLCTKKDCECVHSQETLDKDWFCNAILYLGLSSWFDGLVGRGGDCS